MRLRINTEGVQFFCTLAPEQRTDRDTGVPRLDRETGLPLFQVQLAALDETGGEVLRVTVPGRPEVGVGAPVSVVGLVAIPWSQGDRNGVAYRATSVTGTGAPSVASASPTASTSTEAPESSVPAPPNGSSAGSGSGSRPAGRPAA